ncbi:QRFP-like peptide receptor [Paramacrobiotus metropolitanus]|uniref:QRFP-like peptide receptor n=1 Tax=Paramacrobiotus metropolitanus TaxID=2943436 RepID=UPI0024464860|nr:QRFP-like peptide receptor [Paramacrobiotus metropolitanus]
MSSDHITLLPEVPQRLDNTSLDYDYYRVTPLYHDAASQYPYSTDAPAVSHIYIATPAVVAVLAVFYGSISLLALCGNGLVVLIIASNKRMQSVTNFLLANLASADILIAVAAVPFQFQAALLQRWVLPDFMCIVAPFVQVLSVNVSILTLTVISIERYRALLYPFKARITKSAAGYAIAVIWIIAIVCAAPMAVTLRVVDLGDVVNGPRPFCFPSGLAIPFNDSLAAQEDAWMRSQNRFNGYVAFLVALQFIIPLTIIGFAYITIAMHLWGSSAGPGEQNQQHLYRIKLRKKVIKMLILVVALFAICWLPLQTYNLLTVALPAINDFRYINIIWFCCNFLAMSNSCQNPFILGFYNEKFRSELRSKFKLCFCLRRSHARRATTLTRTTRGETEVGDQTVGFTITRMDRVKQSGKRHANHHTRISDDSPIYGNIKVPLDPADYYD